MAQPLDQSVVNLAKAIRQVETGNRPVSGASGELASRYQYMPATWRSTAKKYLGNENAPLTLENENQATYLKIKEWKDSGMGPDQIASMWNSGKPDWQGKVGVNSAGVKYDTPGYVKKVGAEYAKLKELNPPDEESYSQPTNLNVNNINRGMSIAPEKIQKYIDQGQIQVPKSNLGYDPETGHINSGSKLDKYGNIANDFLSAPSKLVGKIVQGAGSAVGGLVGGIGQVVKNIATKQPIGQDVGKSAMQTGRETAKFGYEVGQGGAETAPLGALGKVPNALMAGAGLYQAGKQFKNSLQDPNYQIDPYSAAANLAVAGVGAYGAVKTNGLIRNKEFNANKILGIEHPQKTTFGNKNKVLNKAEAEIFNIENNYVKTRKVIDYSKDAGVASRKRVAASGVLASAVDESGRIKTKIPGGPIEIYKKNTVDGGEGVVKKLLNREGKSIDPEIVRQQLTTNIYNSGLEGKALKSAISNIDSEIEGLMLRATPDGKIPLEKIHDAKISTSAGINYLTEPFVKTQLKAIARSYKELVEKYSDENIDAINKELQKYYNDLDLLENLDGKIVKGGKLGKYFSQISGNIIGGMAGSAIGGPFGSAIGAIAGGEAGAKIKGKIMKNTIGKPTNPIFQKSEIISKAVDKSKSPRLMLPAPKPGSPRSTLGSGKTINLSARSQSSIDAAHSNNFGKRNTKYSETPTANKKVNISSKVSQKSENVKTNFGKNNNNIKFERAKDLSQKDRKIEDDAFNLINRKEKDILESYKQKQEHKNYINTDELRKEFTDVGYNGSNAAAVQEPASYLAKKLFNDNINNPGEYATFYAGGSGSGKTSAIKNIKNVQKVLDNSSIILDGNLSSYKSAISKLKIADAAGKKTLIVYVYRNPLDSFENGVISRMLYNKGEMGRIVPSKVVAENHIGSWDVIKRLHENGRSVIFIDNSLGAGKSKMVTYDYLNKKINYPSKEQLTNSFNNKAKELYARKEITKEQYDGYIN